MLSFCCIVQYIVHPSDISNKISPANLKSIENPDRLLNVIIMKRNILLFICSLTLSGQIINAQITQQQSVEDSVFGWVRVYHLKGAKELKKLTTVFPVCVPWTKRIINE
jgi:hypothetical protein